MPDRSSASPADRVTSRTARDVVRWLRASLPVVRPKADAEARGAGPRPGHSNPGTDNPYVHYRKVKEALQRANLDFAAAVGANASSHEQERMARRVSRLQVREDKAVLAMRRHDRSWSTRGVVGVFEHSDAAPR